MILCLLTGLKNFLEEFHDTSGTHEYSQSEVPNEIFTVLIHNKPYFIFYVAVWAPEQSLGLTRRADPEQTQATDRVGPPVGGLPGYNMESLAMDYSW